MNMERAVRIDQYGAPEVLAVEPVEVTAPGQGEVRIRHKAIGLNLVEVYFRRGTFPVPAFPATLRNKAAGVVEAVGRDVRGVAAEIESHTPMGRSARTPRRDSIRPILWSASRMRSAPRRLRLRFYVG
jgi:threonine dehydrogenase-like Zn-dependent dehydrogenase